MVCALLWLVAWAIGKRWRRSKWPAYLVFLGRICPEKRPDRAIEIARRTVAKYREQLNIPVARLRKEL